MKTFLVSTVIATLVSVASLFGAESPTQPGQASSTAVDPSKTPEGLSKSDWSGIRGAYERNRHVIASNPDGTHQARNPGQAWLTKFDGRGFTVTPDAGGWSWGLELAGYGEVTEVRQDGGRISYVRGDGLTEWFVNDARGLEQGWTLAKRPERGDATGHIRLNLAVRGSLRPQVSGEGASVAFLDESSGTALTYGGLKAWDADGKIVQARFAEGEVGGMGLCVMVDDSNAMYPITIDPIAQQSYLKASNTGAGDHFGTSVAVSGDTIVVGAPDEDSSATGVNGNQADNSAIDSGAVYIFVRNGATWTQQAYLKASNTGAGDLFGSSVAVSGDTVVVGAYGEDSSAKGVNGSQSGNSLTDSGATYVFVRSGITWSQQAYIKASNSAAYDWFGRSVAVSGDTVVVGAMWQDGSASTWDSGAAYVFVRSGTTWSQQAYLKASNAGANDYFGLPVAVSGDTLVVGASLEDSGATGVNGNQADNSATDSGAAYVFVRSGTTWSQQAYIKASNTDAGDVFGCSVAISGDTLVVGAAYEDSNSIGVNGNQADNSATDSGAAYVFVRSGTTWSQQAYLKASNTGTGDSFGGVAVAADTVFVAAGREDSNSPGINGNQADDGSAWDTGAIYVFARSGSTWSQQAYLKASNSGSGDGIGGIAASDTTFVFGTIYEDGGSTGVNGDQADNSATDSGAVYVFTVPGWYSLSASADHGSIEGSGVHEAGSTATLTVTPQPGYVFSEWTGDATGNDNPLTVVMGSNKTITAVFEPDTNDDDGDGLTNYQEIVVYHTNPSLKDSDDDGFDDLFEVNTGFNPALASSTPDALSTIRTSVEFRFNAANGISYRIEASADLNQWNTIEPVIIGQSAVVTRFYSTENQPKRYFRVRRN